ncbi:hypothetical protein HanIR_Chr17g0875871 [Helianthus annuus]|nr:hypothetical protein HanIR_Chr17g0875871 [Helianthus annuus]
MGAFKPAHRLPKTMCKTMGNSWVFKNEVCYAGESLRTVSTSIRSVRTLCAGSKFQQLAEQAPEAPNLIFKHFWHI